MTDITLRIEKADDLQQVLELVQQLNLTVIQTSVNQAVRKTKDQKKIKDYILSYQNDQSSFGDAADWQRRERSDRELPMQS